MMKTIGVVTLVALLGGGLACSARYEVGGEGDGGEPGSGATGTGTAGASPGSGGFAGSAPGGGGFAGTGTGAEPDPEWAPCAPTSGPPAIVGQLAAPPL